MRQTVKYFIILFILNLVLVLDVKSQVYPVQLNMQLIPPYSLRLSDYVAPGTNRVGLNMLLTDINESGYQVRLELTIEGNGITIKTSPNYNHAPVILDGGVPQYFTSSDLAEWFNPQNLDFSGYSKSSYLATGRLPEGVYRFSFAAYDYNKNIRVSSNFPITAWLMLNEPPLINIPFPDYKVEHINPQNIVFQWTPRHTASPNSAFTAEYEFTLVEIWPEGRDPNNAIQTSIPIFQATTTSTTLVYGLAEPFLEPGRQYAYRIQARDVDGRDMFKNNGYSEVRMFTFGDECKPVENVSATSEKYNTAEIKWTPGFSQTAFTVRYRKANKPDAGWFEQNTFIDKLKLTDLQELTTYEYQVMGFCGTYEGDYSDVQTFTTPAPEVSGFECGGGDDESSISNHEPLPMLRDGDYVWSGSFMFQVYDVTGGNGTFSGKAFAMVPYLSYVKLAAEFRNIKVNTDNQVYEGEIKSVYNPNSPFFVTVDLDGEDYNTENDSIIATDDGGLNDTTLVADIDSIFIDGDDIIILNEDGTTDTIHTTDDIIITDSDGDTWIVENGDVIVGDGNGPDGDGSTTDNTETTDEIQKPKIIVTFEKFNEQQYGFDTYSKDLPAGMFTPPYDIGGNEYYASWKSNSSGSFDHVTTNIENSDTIYKNSDIKYRTATGISLTSENIEENKQKIFLYGQVDKTVDEIIAFVTSKDSSGTEIELGKLRTISYQKRTYHLKVVPVNMEKEELNITTLTNEIREIYKQSTIEWNITLDNKFEITTAEWDKDENSLLDDSESGIFANYTNEMNKIIGKYKNERDPDDDFYYVFICKDIKPQSGNLAGYMPFKQQFGLLFTQIIGTDPNTVSRTISHEIGHGAFRLYHTFSNNNTFVQSAYTTDNLMDYNGGTHLHKYQWDFIHDPQDMIVWLQSDEEMASVNILTLLSQIREANKNETDFIQITQDQCPQVCYKNVKLGDETISLLQLNCSKDFENAELNENTQAQFIDWDGLQGEKVIIKPSEKSLRLSETNVGKVTYYKFHEAKEKPVPEAPEMTDNFLFEIAVPDKDKVNFEEYLYPLKKPLPGDPLINMEIVGIISTSKIGGTYGCVRWTDDDDQKNCDEWVENITNFPTILDKNKVHDGIDLLAPIGTPVYAMFDGVATVAYSSKLGNFVLIESTQDEHNLLGIEEKIWCSYGHLNSYENIVGKVKQGQLIGYSGNTGTTASGIDSWRYHLHLTIYKGGTDKYNRVNPITFTTTKFDSNGNKIN